MHGVVICISSVCMITIDIIQKYYKFYKCCIIIKLMFPKLLMLIRQLVVISVLLVPIDSFQRKGLGFKHLFLRPKKCSLGHSPSLIVKCVS